MENENRRYILTSGYALRGWKLLPYAIQYLYAPRTEFFREDDWALISTCDGQTDIDWNALTDAQRERYEHSPGIPLLSRPFQGERTVVHHRALQL